MEGAVFFGLFWVAFAIYFGCCEIASAIRNGRRVDVSVDVKHRREDGAPT